MADRFFRQILDQPAVRASLRYALLQHLPGSPPVGIAAVMHGYDFGEINLAAEYTFLVRRYLVPLYYPRSRLT